MNTTFEDALYVVSGYLDFADLVRLCSCRKSFFEQIQDVLPIKKKKFLKEIFHVSRCMSVMNTDCTGENIGYDEEFDLLQVSGVDPIIFQRVMTPVFACTVSVMKEMEDIVLEMIFSREDFQAKCARRAFAKDVSMDLFL